MWYQWVTSLSPCIHLSRLAPNRFVTDTISTLTTRESAAHAQPSKLKPPSTHSRISRHTMLPHPAISARILNLVLTLLTFLSLLLERHLATISARVIEQESAVAIAMLALTHLRTPTMSTLTMLVALEEEEEGTLRLNMSKRGTPPISPMPPLLTVAIRHIPKKTLHLSLIHI